MIYVKVPATSANLGSGFDSFGLAFKLYDCFGFEACDADDLSSFSPEYRENNLVMYAYKYFFNRYHIPYIAVKIIPIEESIPVSRGLGSSASLVVAGLLAANYISGYGLEKRDLISLGAEIEGHPDNVAPALMGGLNASIKDNDHYLCFNYPISEEISFYAFIPDQRMSTKDSRAALPTCYSLPNVTFNLSRAANLAFALGSGNMEYIKVCSDDRIHEPYRLPLINNALAVKERYEGTNSKLLISGSGSTLLLICDKNYRVEEDFFLNFKIRKLDIDMDGGKVYEM